MPKLTREQIEDHFEAALSSPLSDGATEADLVAAFMRGHLTGHCLDEIPHHRDDTVVTEMAFRYGRADIVVFHIDGSASVIEAKDGARGYQHVVAGIGQVGLYATQLALTKGAITRIRRCLMWASTDNLVADALIERACVDAGVIPIGFQPTRWIKAVDVAALMAAEAAIARASAT